MKINDLVTITTRHAREVACLVSEGYREAVTTNFGHDLITTNLRHNNGNKIMLSSNLDGTYFYKNNRLIKTVHAASSPANPTT